MKTRFAPSPTGHIHLGNVRTALFNWLAAHSAQGTFLLRIEDTDQERSEDQYRQALMDDLRWLGLQWDEGPETEGDLGPYLQSRREELYHDYFVKLIEQQVAYPCFCTEEALKVSRKLQKASGLPPKYAGTCLGLSAEEIEAKKQQGIPATLRFRVANEGKIAFTDLVRGKQEFACKDIGDFIIRRSDGSPSFFFSNAIDDSLMQVTHVLRGEDHLTNTPRQQLILEALDLTMADYAHISLVVGANGTPLSKRHGSKSVQELREQGFLPAAVINYLARLGHHFENEAYMSPEDLAAAFSIERLGKAPARYQLEQLMYWQHEAIMHADDQSLWHWMSEVEKDELKVDAFVPADMTIEFVRMIRENLMMPEDAINWAGNLFTKSELYDQTALDAIKEAGKGFFQQAILCLEKIEENDFKAFTDAVSVATGCKGKSLFMSLRAALSGEVHGEGWISEWKRGPQLAALWDFLGAKKIMRRLVLAESNCD